MTADVIALTVPANKGRRRRKPEQPYIASSLVWEARQALRMIQGAIEELEANPGCAKACLGAAEKNLAAGIEAHTEASRRDVRRIVQDAFGPDVTCGEINGARRALSLILRSLPAYED